jgi:predicted DNA-binding ribbon-helix-helix protein
MKSPVVKRTTRIHGPKTSVSLSGTRSTKITATQKIRVSVVSIIEFNGERRHANLSSAIRLFVLDHLSQHVSRPIAPSMTLGNMREL